MFTKKKILSFQGNSCLTSTSSSSKLQQSYLLNKENVFPQKNLEADFAGSLWCPRVEGNNINLW